SVRHTPATRTATTTSPAASTLGAGTCRSATPSLSRTSARIIIDESYRGAGLATSAPGPRMRQLLVATPAVALAGCSLFRTPAPAPHLAHPVAPVEDPDTESIGVTWIGHATVLVRIKDRWFLTDPVFSDRLAGLY